MPKVYEKLISKHLVFKDRSCERELLLVDCRYEQGIYIRVSQILKNNYLSIRIGSAMKERISTTFYPEEMTRLFVGFYNTILRKEGSIDC